MNLDVAWPIAWHAPLTCKYLTSKLSSTCITNKFASARPSMLAWYDSCPKAYLFLVWLFISAQIESYLGMNLFSLGSILTKG